MASGTSVTTMNQRWGRWECTEGDESSFLFSSSFLCFFSDVYVLHKLFFCCVTPYPPFPPHPRYNEKGAEEEDMGNVGYYPDESAHEIARTREELGYLSLHIDW